MATNHANRSGDGLAVSDDHDPGPDAAAARVADLESVAAEPIDSAGGRILVGTASWTDPTMTAAGVFYPSGADNAEERLAYYAAIVPGRRGRRDVLRPACRADGAAVGRADPAGLHLRHQGPRPDDRARGPRRAVCPKSIREALPAEIQAKTRIYAKDFPAELNDEVWRMFRSALGRRSRSAASSARSCSSTRNGCFHRARTGR